VALGRPRYAKDEPSWPSDHLRCCARLYTIVLIGDAKEKISALSDLPPSLAADAAAAT